MSEEVGQRGRPGEGGLTGPPPPAATAPSPRTLFLLLAPARVGVEGEDWTRGAAQCRGHGGSTSQGTATQGPALRPSLLGRACSSVPQALDLTKRLTLGRFKVTGQLPPQLRVQHCDSKGNPPAGAGDEPRTDRRDTPQEAEVGTSSVKHEQELGFQKNQSGRCTYYMINVIAERQQERAEREKPGEMGARPTLKHQHSDTRVGRGNI